MEVFNEFGKIAESLQGMMPAIDRQLIELRKLEKMLPDVEAANLRAKIAEIEQNRRNFDHEMTKLNERCQF